MIKPGRFSSSTHGRFGAFTLIELLVVIAIIGILAAMLLPALNKARDKGRAAYCLGNMRQWGLALNLYSDDWDDWIAAEGFSPPIDSAGNAGAWYNSVSPYVRQPRLVDLYAAGKPPTPYTKSIFSCPSAKPPTSPPTVAVPYFMYGLNGRIDPGGTALFKRSVVVNPAQTVLFTEAQADTTFSHANGQYAQVRHFGAANLVFVDGHAELVLEADFRRTAAESNSSVTEWATPRKVYWFPYPGAPN